MYYGVYDDDVYYSRKDFASRESLLKNKLCGEGQNNRLLMIQKMELQIQVIENVEIKSINFYF